MRLTRWNVNMAPRAKKKAEATAGEDYAWRPNSQVQYDFLSATEFEALYGGAKGGGKSRALVADALRLIDRPTYKAIIFRRTFPRLRELTDFAAKIYTLYGGVGKQSNTEWTFPSGAQILFGHMQHEKDTENHHGVQYQLVAWDQLEQFTKAQYDSIRSCVRSEDPTIPCYMRATSNPGGVGHGWVKEYFIDTCPPKNVGPPIFDETFKVTWQPQRAGKGFVSPEGITRQFYPAKVFDNPDLLLANPHYVSVLKELPPQLCKAYLDGDYNIFQGQYFPEFSETLHVRPPRTVQEGITDEWGIPLSWPRWGGIDYGSANPWAAGELATDPSNGKPILYRTIAAKGWTHEEQAKWLLAGSPNADYVADDACFYRGNEADSKVKQISDAELWAQHGFNRVRPAHKGGRVAGWAHLRQFLKKQNDTTGFLEISDTPGARGRYGIITVFPKMVHDEKNPEDMESECPDEARDDALDFLRYACLQRPAPAARPDKPRRPWKHGDYWKDPNKVDEENLDDDGNPIDGTVVGDY